MKFEIPTDDGPQAVGLPFVILVLGDFCGDQASSLPALAERQVLDVPAGGVDALMDQLRPRVRFRVDDVLLGSSDDLWQVDVSFRALADLEPSGLIQNIPALAQMWQERQQRSDAARSEFDAALSRQLAEIVHHKQFQQLEGAWRGLTYLVSHLAAANNDNPQAEVEVRMLQVTADELRADLSQPGGIERSALLSKLEAEPSPVTVMVGDFSFGVHPQEQSLLNSLASVAMVGQCPLIAAAKPELLGLHEWRDLKQLKPPAGPVYAKWNSLRQTPASRYLGLAAPRLLARPPYGELPLPGEVFSFDEVSAGGGKANYCWMNPAFGVASQLLHGFAETAWCAGHRRDAKRRRLDDLPWQSFPTDHGDSRRIGAEIGIASQAVGSSLASLGIIPITLDTQDDVAEIPYLPSVHKPQEMDEDLATLFHQFSAQLTCTMTIVRITLFLSYVAHYGRGSIGSDKGWRERLEAWLRQYVVSEAPATITDAQPLAAASVEVKQTGTGLQATVGLRPWLPEGDLPLPLKVPLPLG